MSVSNQMRHHYVIPIGLLGLAAALAGGCDNITAGQPNEPDGPPKLVRVMVQDADVVPFPHSGRGGITDLLDTGAQVHCDLLNPCVDQYLVGGGSFDFSCNLTTNICPDPLRAGKVLLEPPVDKNTGYSVRLVFNKLLDDGIESTTRDGSKPPGADLTYALRDGIISLVDDTGAEVMTEKSYDVKGAPTDSSDPVVIPFGPALVLKTLVPLNPATTYTIKLDPTLLKDRKGLGAADASGTPFSGPQTFKFTVEDLALSATTPDTSDPTKPPAIKANEVFQVAFWAPTDEASFTGTVTGDSGAVQVAAYAERGAVPTDCAKNLDPTIINLVPISAPNTPTNWAPGNYTVHFVIKDALGRSTFTSNPDFKFTVSADTGADDDPALISKHLLPAQCK